MKIAIALALVCSVASAQNSDTTCQQIGQQLICHTQTQTPPSGSFDPSVISHISDESDSSRRMQCVMAGKAAGMSREQIVAACFH
jgi:hypothetical protein